MTIATKIFLGISITGFVVGSVIDFGGLEVNPMLTAVLPVGAIFLGVFLISLVLEKEVALFDKEQALKLALVREHAAKSHAAPIKSNL
jgi:hypothetical protein